MADKEAFFIVDGVNEPTGNAVGTVTADFASVGVEEFPVSPWKLIWRVEDGLIEKWIGHDVLTRALSFDRLITQPRCGRRLGTRRKSLMLPPLSHIRLFRKHL